MKIIDIKKEKEITMIIMKDMKEEDIKKKEVEKIIIIKKEIQILKFIKRKIIKKNHK